MLISEISELQNQAVTYRAAVSGLNQGTVGGWT